MLYKVMNMSSQKEFVADKQMKDVPIYPPQIKRSTTISFTKLVICFKVSFFALHVRKKRFFSTNDASSFFWEKIKVREVVSASLAQYHQEPQQPLYDVEPLLWHSLISRKEKKSSSGQVGEYQKFSEGEEEETLKMMTSSSPKDGSTLPFIIIYYYFHFSY